MWYPDLPDRTCPVCQATVKYEKGYYDQKPLYRCASCSYVLKPPSEISTIAKLVLAVIGITIMSFVAGQLIVAATPPTPGVYQARTLFTPPPSPRGAYSSPSTP